MSRPKVTVYIPSHNYGSYLREAVESVRRQTHPGWELIILDDASTDDSAEIARACAAQEPDKIRCHINDSPQGLRRCANLALELARGEYIMRLDADDYLDESALLVLAGFLDQHEEIALVYPNWTYIDEHGAWLGTERRKKVGSETNVLDLPAHGACTMVRKRVLKSIGGYDTVFDSQDGHELWLKVLHRFKIANVSTPLFFYRQHSGSMSTNEERLLGARRRIKEALTAANRGPVRPKVVAVIPAKNTYAHLPNVVLNPICGKPLLDYTLEAALGCGVCSHVYVFTDDPAVIAHCAKFPGVLAELRPSELSSPRTKLADVLATAVERLESEHDIFADIVALLPVHTPLRQPHHICEAVDTLLLYDVDNVISTYEDVDLHFLHGKNGMQPLNPGMINQVRFEREALYVDNNAVHVTWRDCISPASLYEGKVGHFVMPRRLSHNIKSDADIAIVSALLERDHQPENPAVASRC